MPKEIADTVAKVIAAGQIGQPVFTRCLIGLPDAPTDRAGSLADAVLAIRKWYGTPIERVFGAGSWERGISIHLQFRNGASALISQTNAPSRVADLIVLGNHGAIYHDAISTGLAPFCSVVPE